MPVRRKILILGLRVVPLVSTWPALRRVRVLGPEPSSTGMHRCGRILPQPRPPAQKITSTIARRTPTYAWARRLAGANFRRDCLAPGFAVASRKVPDRLGLGIDRCAAYDSNSNIGWPRLLRRALAMSLRKRTAAGLRDHRLTCEAPLSGPRLGGLCMHRRNLILGVIASSYLGIRWVNAWPLVTRQQEQRENAAAHKQAVPGPTRSGAPTITVEEPDIIKPVRSPVKIRVRFHAGANAKIVVNSLRVTYGFLKIDITRRLLAHARPTPSGVFVQNADLPRGRHKVTIQIADNMGRVGVKSFDFNVV
jgi:hypothetical protein